MDQSSEYLFSVRRQQNKTQDKEKVGKRVRQCEFLTFYCETAASFSGQVTLKESHSYFMPLI